MLQFKITAALLQIYPESIDSQYWWIHCAKEFQWAKVLWL